VVRSREGEMIYLGTQAVLLQTGLLITKAEYPATPQRPVFVTGRVEFLDVPHNAAGKDGDMRKDEVSLWIFTHNLAELEGWMTSSSYFVSSQEFSSSFSA